MNCPVVIRILVPGALIGAALLWCHTASAQDAAAVDYSRDIRPILSNNCFRCHGPDEAQREAGLRLDTPDGAVADLGGYQAIVPENPEASHALVRILSSDPDEQMPPPDSGLKLTDAEISLLKQWIQQGAGYTQHWSFRPVQRPAVPIVSGTPSATGAGSLNPIDYFVRQRLHMHGLTASPEAEQTVLLRRVFLDVTGLPPALEEIEFYLSDESADAYAKMVERALASPHYGERWGRHWLDQARYADTNGYTVDSDRSIWPYRDWVIKALNDDMPFDEFSIQQLAGDLLPEPTRDQLVATGFHRNTLVNQEGGTDAEQFRNEAVVDRVNTTGAVWLGLTIGCAQCHTHKYDPITHHEYYQLFDFFNHGKDVNSVGPTLRLPTPEQDSEVADLDEQIRLKKGEPAADLKKYEDQKKKILSAVAETMVMADLDNPRETFVHLRGDFLRKGDKVSAQAPEALGSMPETDKRRTRLDLARWLVDPQNPLTARVTVNRIWARYFGQGLVRTENDFGLQGTPPTHPELLDWLAAEFMDADWSLKHLHRLILNSATYRQSSHQRDDLETVDPLNKLLARQVRLRVDAEIVRDLALAASGLLSRTIGGRSVRPPQPDGVYAFTQRNAAWPVSTGDDRYRRGMYTFFMRSAPYPMLTTFDTPLFDTTCTLRIRSNTPLQSLTMANDQTMLEMADALGKRLIQHSQSDSERIQLAFRLCLARTATAAELARLMDFVEQQKAASESEQPSSDELIPASESQVVEGSDAKVWMLVARAIMNLDEFIVRE